MLCDLLLKWTFEIPVTAPSLGELVLCRRISSLISLACRLKVFTGLSGPMHMHFTPNPLAYMIAFKNLNFPTSHSYFFSGSWMFYHIIPPYNLYSQMPTDIQPPCRSDGLQQPPHRPLIIVSKLYHCSQHSESVKIDTTPLGSF